MRNNVTEVYFNGQEMTAILVHWQHDYKQIIKFADLDLPFAYEVDFANAGDTQSKTMIGNADGVEIPDEYLMTGKAINAYIYLHDASDSGETVRKVSIQVHGRPERTEEIPDPHQQSVIDQAIAALDDAVEQTASDVQTTGEYREEAHGYADEAKGYAERAESAESEVEGYATRAETAESHAQGYAQTASDKASEASGYASDAQGYSNSASSSASDAHRYASDAYGYADSAYQSYQGASGYAHDAHTYAQSASDSASDASSAKDLAVQAKNDAISAKNDAVSAKNDAETAKGKAEDAQESAERAAGSVLGLTADATVDSNTGTPSVDVNVSTVSDHKNMSFYFHNLKGVPGTPGQDGFAPTVSVSEITGGHEVSITDAQGTQTFDVMDGEVSEEELETALIDKADVITSTASGSIVTIADGGKDMPVVDLKVSLLPVQSGSGDPSPSNVRPISGWTGANLFRTKENIFGGNLLRDGIQASMESATDDSTNRCITYAANASVSQTITEASGLTGRFKENTQYTFIMTVMRTGGSSLGSNMQINYTDWTYTYFPNVSALDTKETITVVSESGKTIRHFSKRNQSGKTTVYYDESGVFEGVLTASDFKPYVGNKYPISWQSSAGTVYGGSLDVTSGVLTVTHHYQVLTGTEPWALNSTYYRFSVIPSNGFPSKAYGQDIISNKLDVTGFNSNRYCGIHSTQSVLWQDATALKADLASWYANNDPAYLVYLLDTPTTYQLTPTQISTLLGTNNFWSNGNGVVDLEYRCDTKLYIEQLTKPSEDDMVANANIASGRFFMVNNRLFLSTQAISQGETIVPGTNCSEISLADALNQINS